jgi:hypothetical protein
MTQARKIDSRLTGLTKAYELNGIHPGKVKHVVVSRPDLLPESKKNDKRAVQKYINQCQDVLKSSAQDGWSGGIHIFHPFRHKGLNKETQEWEEIEFDAPKDHYIRTKWVWSPHVHFIAYGFFENGKEVHKRTGFILKRVQDQEGKERNIRETAFYLMTHSGIWLDQDGKQRGQAYAYFGEYSTNAGGRMKVGTVDELQPCEKCKSPLVKWQLDLGPDEPTLEFRNGICRSVDNDYLERWADRLKGGWCHEDYVITKTVYEYHLSNRALTKCHRQTETEDTDQDNVRIVV